MPYVIQIIVQIVTSRAASSTFDSICTLFVLINSLQTCVFLYLFDNRIKQNVHQLFRIKSKSNSNKLTETKGRKDIQEKAQTKEKKSTLDDDL